MIPATRPSPESHRSSATSTFSVGESATFQHDTLVMRSFPRPCGPPSWPNVVLAAKGTGVDYPEHRGPLSIKAVLRGVDVHEIGGVPLAVDRHRYLVLNEGRRYASYFMSDAVEVFCVFFNTGFVAQALASRCLSDEGLLDQPDTVRSGSVEFVERPYPHDEIVTPAIHSLSRGVAAGEDDPLWLEERLHLLLMRLLELHASVTREIESFPGGRPSTREEAYRRLWRARDFMDSDPGRPSSLAEVASAACLSRHHLIRLFKAAFGLTPHQYLTERRIDMAKRLLADTDLSVADIRTQIGFSSLGTFSDLFRRRVGQSPRKYRASVTRSH